MSGEERQWQPRPPPDCSAGPHGAAPPAHRGSAPSPRRGALDPAMATDSTLFLWMGLGFGWQREGRGKMEARVAVDPPATGSGSTRSSDRDAMGANHAPDTCDDGGTLDSLPLDLHPCSVGLCGLCGAAGYRELTRVVRFSWAGSQRGLCMFAAWWTQWVRVVARATCIQTPKPWACSRNLSALFSFVAAPGTGRHEELPHRQHSSSAGLRLPLLDCITAFFS